MVRDTTESNAMQDKPNLPDAETMDAYREAAADEGFSSADFSNFEGACRLAHAAGITPADIPAAIDDGRIDVDFDGPSLFISVRA